MPADNAKLESAPDGPADRIPFAAAAENLSATDLVRAVETLRGGGQANTAELLYEAWIDGNPSDPLLFAVLFNYSVALADAGKLGPAKESLVRAIALNGDFVPAFINLGRLCERQGDVRQAVEYWSSVRAKLGQVNGSAVGYKTTALNQSARVLETAGQDQLAEGMLKESLDIDCHQSEVIRHWVALRQRQCKWPVIVPSERTSSRALTVGMSPLSMAIYADDPMRQLAHSYNYNKEEIGFLDSRTPPSVPNRSGPLRIGYLSSDLREHAVGYLLSDVFALHDRNAVAVSAYYCGPPSADSLHLRFKASADHWTDISGLDDVSAARRIAEDGIQILVDLNGYTRDARLKVLALRPAPVIVSWLGFPGTTGSPYHHYIIADDWIIPKGEEIYYSERVLRLPCYQPSARNREVSANVLSRSDAGLPEGDFIFCCFNGSQKITRFTFERWLKILKMVPRSVLWLLDGPEGTSARLREYASQQGVPGARLIFADKAPNAVHLARHRLADLFLDTAPYGAHTTASDALWMGLPVLTLGGRSFASRVCGSLVRAAEIPEMICDSSDEYVQRAVEFGRDPTALLPVRERLQARRDSCLLFDTAALVSRLEALFGRMWDEFESGDLPQPDLTNLDAYLEVGSRVNHEDADSQTILGYRGWWKNNLAEWHRFRRLGVDSRFVESPDTLDRK